MARVRLLVGPARSDRRQHIHSIAVERWGASRLVVPTRHEAYERTRQIVSDHRLNGAWGRPVVSFEDFALDILRGEGLNVHPIDALDRRMLVEGVVGTLAAEGRLDRLAGAAQSGGFVNHVLRVITQLKQAAVDPQQFRAAVRKRRRPSWLDGIVADVYEAYQGALRASNAYDRVGVYWQAELIARRKPPSALAGLDLLLFDGFDDFTPSEFRVIESVNTHVDELVFGVSCVRNNSWQQDLYQSALATAARIRSSFELVDDRDFPEEPCRTLRDHCVRYFLSREPPPSPEGLEQDIDLIQCSDPAHELETMARTIKTLIVEQEVSPEHIAIVYRRLADVLPNLRAVFQEFGIPFTEHAPPCLADRSFATFVTVLLNAIQSWSRVDVLDTITSPWFSGGPSSDRMHVGAFPLLAKLAAIVEGRDEWLTRASLLATETMKSQDDATGYLQSRVPNAADAVDAFCRSVSRLAELAELLPRRGKRRQLADAVQSIIERCVVEPPSCAQGVGPFHEFDSHAVAGVRRLLRRIAAEIGNNATGAEIDAMEFIQELRRAFDDAPCDAPSSGSGVYVLDAEAARLRAFGYVFLAGMNEGVFPAPPPAGVIYTDRDIDDLISSGVRLEKRSDHSQREMLLFHHVLESASKRLYVLWPTVTAEGKPLLPSPLIEDLRMLTGRAVERLNASARAFLPALADVACPRDLRNAARAEAGAEELEHEFKDEFVQVEIGASIERRRYSDKPFDNYDGIIGAKDLLAQLAAAFGPDHPFSVAQFERYAKCPFGFFAERILGVESVESPAVEFDAKVRGQILHEVLQLFHQKFCGRAVYEIPEEEARGVMSGLVDEVFARRSHHSVTAPRGVSEVERARMKVVLDRYLTGERSARSEWKPAHFEVSFGRTPSPSADPLSREEFFALDTADGVVLVSGRIDRIDLDDGRARIVDYKSRLDPNTVSSEIKHGVALQLSLYAMAMERALMPGVECAEACFIQPGAPKSVEGLKKAKNEWDMRAEIALSSVVRCLNGIRSGQFPPTPFKDRCSLCALHRVCRHEAFRIDRKTTP